MHEKKKFFTVPQVAKLCSVSRMTVHRWVDSGKIKFFTTPGGHKRIQSADLKVFFKHNNMPIDLSRHNRGKKRILIADDDISVQKYLSQILSGPMTNIQTALDGFEAGIKVVSFEPDLIILDLFMPNMDGFEVCKQIKENPETKKVKVLIMTGKGIEKNQSKAMALGANAFLGKPSDKKDIIACVERLLSG